MESLDEYGISGSIERRIIRKKKKKKGQIDLIQE